MVSLQFFVKVTKKYIQKFSFVWFLMEGALV